MRQSYWHTYVQETDADEVERHLQRTTFLSGATGFLPCSWLLSEELGEVRT